MELTDAQKQQLRQLFLARGDAIIANRLIERGIDEDAVHEAARRCSNRIWKNSMASGALTGVLLGTIFTPVVGGIAGSSMAALVGFQTLLHSEACRDVRDWDLQIAVRQINSGF
jgi:hypothetical protein